MIGIYTIEEAKLYYLYMLADGEVHSREETKFDQICKELKIEPEAEKEIIKECKNSEKQSQDLLNVIINEKIDEKAGRGMFGIQNVSSQARIIWNLVDLGYADREYSNEEKRIVNYLVDKWSVNSEILQEFVDTADTILALTRQKSWIYNQFPRGAERNKREKKVDNQIMELLEDVKLTIKELTM